MSHNKANIFKIKDGKLDQWLAWCDELNTTRRDEALATLQDEGVSCEFFITFQINGAHYTLGAEIADEKSATSPSNEQSINLVHKKIKGECLEFVSSGDFSYLLK